MTLDQPPGCAMDPWERQVLPVRAGEINRAPFSHGPCPGVTIPNDTLPGVKGIGFWDAAGPQDWGLDPHRNDGVEILFVETGSMVFLADEQRFHLGPGDFAITRPGQSHKLGDPHVGPGRVHWLIIDVAVRKPNDPWRWPGWVTLTPADLAELTHKLRRNKMPVGRSTPEITRIFRQVARGIGQWKTPHSASRLIANLNQLLVNFLDTPVAGRSMGNSDRSSGRRVVELFLKGLAENPAGCQEMITLREMAEQCDMGITSFARHTRELVNVSPMEFLKQCRLNHAARQLCEKPGASITEICFSNGFNSSQYFATCFRKRFKMSPTEFVLKQR